MQPRTIAVAPKPIAARLKPFVAVAAVPRRPQNKLPFGPRLTAVTPPTRPPSPPVVHLAQAAPTPVSLSRPDAYSQPRAAPRRPVPSAAPVLTLPSSENNYDPEADARLRKFDWSKTAPVNTSQGSETVNN